MPIINNTLQLHKSWAARGTARTMATLEYQRDHGGQISAAWYERAVSIMARWDAARNI